MSGRASLLALGLPLLVGGCLGGGGGHSSFEADLAVPLPETIPTPEELFGVWQSTRTSGGLEEVARAFVYSFRPDGEYSAAVLVDAETGYEWLALAGRYHYAEGALELGEGAPSFAVRRQGELLHLRGDEGNLVLSPFLEEQRALAGAAPDSSTPAAAAPTKEAPK